jgi:hypothetical protein
MGLVGLILDPQLLFQAPLGFLQPRWARARDRSCLLGALVIKTTLGLTQPPEPVKPDETVSLRN